MRAGLRRRSPLRARPSDEAVRRPAIAAIPADPPGPGKPRKVERRQPPQDRRPGPFRHDLTGRAVKADMRPPQREVKPRKERRSQQVASILPRPIFVEDKPRVCKVAAAGALRQHAGRADAKRRLLLRLSEVSRPISGDRPRALERPTLPGRCQRVADRSAGSDKATPTILQHRGRGD